MNKSYKQETLLNEGIGKLKTLCVTSLHTYIGSPMVVSKLAVATEKLGS